MTAARRAAGVAYWISCSQWTVRVETDDDDVIVKAAPIVRKFRGQPLDNLLRWAMRLGDVKVEMMGVRCAC